ncbi:DNA repair protein RadC [Azospirillum fermentarium]|uniref:RadC family protein n=1 Tax=Azospirillum fermentarium TaxID=1233114 RepID=UPI0022262EB0|nr:DNA repair protein RadC [Azospirillum fermentarium]MCW2245852.1 DNA repair protein RadC [Azospirillum fermentarium]
MASRSARSTPAAGEEDATLPGLSDAGGTAITAEAEAPPHYVDHRDRLRTRFLAAGPDALQDYELLEMILFPVSPRRDVKPLAKALLKEFGSLWAVLMAPPEKLRGFAAGGVGLTTDRGIAVVRAVGAAALRAMRQEVMNRPVLASWQAVLDYCTAAMAHEATEQFRLLFLDRKNVLIADEVQQRGTVDHTPVYPREVVRRALDLGASSLILVHNHPSGDPTPSRADIEMTREINRAAEALGIVIHDHIVIGKGKHASFKALHLL